MESSWLKVDDGRYLNLASAKSIAPGERGVMVEWCDGAVAMLLEGAQANAAMEYVEERVLILRPQ